MTPRLSHRKSLLGCLRCKARKVKCDEKRPKCKHCSRHDIPCEYPSLETRAYNPQKQRNLRSRSQTIPSPLEMENKRIFELRLMHNWVTATADTMSSAQIASVSEMWKIAVPEMALEYEPLLHTLLAISAAHRATLFPDQANVLRPIYHAYIDSTLQEHRPVTANLDGSTDETVCLNAMLISLYTFFLRSEPSNEAYEPPLLWLSMARGIRTIMQTVYLRLLKSKSRLCPILLADQIWKDHLTAYNGSVRPFQFLVEHLRNEEDIDDEASNAYDEALAFIEHFHASSCSREISAFSLRRVLLGFPPLICSRFFDLVSEKRPRALVILAYLFAISKKADGVWWLKGIPEREVHGINSILPCEWRCTMAWPLDMISGISSVPRLGEM